jgi:spore maturation protein SpmB
MAEQTENKYAGKNIVDIFVIGIKKGYNMSINNMMPNVLMAFVFIRICKLTGILDLVGNIFAPVMGVFGLPGQGMVVLIAAFLSMGGGCGVAASLLAEGVLNSTHITIIIPAIFLVGAELQYMGRLLGTVGVQAKYYLPMIGLSVLNACISMILMRILLGVFG